MKKNKITQKPRNNKAIKTEIDLTTYQDLKNIQVHGERWNSKASELYLDVTFSYENEIWEGSIPIQYRRTGTELSDVSEIKEYLLQAYDHCHPNKRNGWLVEQEQFWRDKKAKAEVTKSLFDVLTTFQWTCISCKFPNNPNWSRRNQELKELGFTIATYLNKDCEHCLKPKTTRLILVPLPRGGITGYEAWSPQTRDRIIANLKSYDVYEGKIGKKESLLPDHKFPEIRWDINTRRSQNSLNNLTEEEVKNDFQLMTNQRNLQKREICRKCFQDNIRPFPFGIKFYYQGNEKWPLDVPKIGKKAETGCIGCGWYDMKKWRDSLNQKLVEFVEHKEN